MFTHTYIYIYIFTHPVISQYLSVHFAVARHGYYTHHDLQGVKFKCVNSNRGNGYVYGVTIISAFPSSRVLSCIKSTFAFVNLTIMVFT